MDCGKLVHSLQTSELLRGKRHKLKAEIYKSDLKQVRVRTGVAQHF